MALYHMTTKTFIKDFIKCVDINDVLNYQYVVISDTLRVSNDDDFEVQKMPQLFPKTRMVSDYLSSQDEEEFINVYYNYLNETDQFYYLAIIVKASLDEDIVIITAPIETEKLPFVQVLRDVISNEFYGYPIYDFCKFKRGREKIIQPNVHKINKKYKTVSRKILENSDYNNRSLIVSEMSKSELKKQMKNMGVSTRGLSKEDMREIIIDLA